MPNRVAAVLAAAAVTAGAAFADTGRKQIKLTAADQAAARAALVRRSDLPGAPWLGGRIKPDLSQTSTCRDYRPKQSDLVLTGIAESSFTRRDGRWYVNSGVQMVRTTRMLRLDWQRVVVAPRAIRCHRRDMAKRISRNGRLLSFRRIPFPRLTRYAVEYRAVVYCRQEIPTQVGGSSTPFSSAPAGPRLASTSSPGSMRESRPPSSSADSRARW
jgi:hypothetical protein